MSNNRLRAGGRSVGLLVLAVIVSGIAGSVVSHYLARVFPAGPVRDFFFASQSVGIPALTLELGFLKLTVGLAFAITTFVVLLMALAVYLWYKL